MAELTTDNSGKERLSSSEPQAMEDLSSSNLTENAAPGGASREAWQAVRSNFSQQDLLDGFVALYTAVGRRA
ncbi:MAG: hypothetical protein ACOCZE_13165 [Planctomycetota bacterium]